MHAVTCTRCHHLHKMPSPTQEPTLNINDGHPLFLENSNPTVSSNHGFSLQPMILNKSRKIATCSPFALKGSLHKDICIAIEIVPYLIIHQPLNPLNRPSLLFRRRTRGKDNTHLISHGSHTFFALHSMRCSLSTHKSNVGPSSYLTKITGSRA